MAMGSMTKRPLLATFVLLPLLASAVVTQHAQKQQSSTATAAVAQEKAHDTAKSHKAQAQQTHHEASHKAPHHRMQLNRMRRHVKHSSGAAQGHREWATQSIASTPEEIREVQQREAAIFEQGRKLKARKAEFYKRLEACGQGVACQRRIMKEQAQAERRIAMGLPESPAETEGAAVTDDMGRSMPVLFNGQPQPTEPPQSSSWFSSLFR
eukprot:TRINITY_DN92986_c0_g1_i1.p2 TRINITY_DN92986_c0_g1~~TRINITY_DN92986_c0_g1_i1.p2  ORF type:complete len:210 (-),score=65.98 TRINITY_DN92986_c0_g1_i1:33-662(-)